MAEARIKNWCAYQERSQHETRLKLHSFGLTTEEADLIISSLISENFLNEERFSLAFAGGKFRIKHWGRNKIKVELKQHRISDYLVNKALRSIDGDEYEKIMNTIIEKKLRSLNTADRRKKYYAVLSYAVSRGFESDLVSAQLNNILKTEHESRS